jgi:hypothetical protein
MMFLSRQYDIIPYVLLALGATAPGLDEPPGAGSERFTGRDVARVLGLTFGGIVVVYILVRVLAVWS